MITSEPRIGSQITPTTSTNKGVDPLALQSSVADLLGFQSQAQQYDAAAAGSEMSALGADAEAAAYATASGIATENAGTEAIAESIRQIQIMREVEQTVGGISASVAANGFQQSGSALDLMASSYRQGYLSQQISGMQSGQTQRGYLEQAAAANGEMAAAQTRGGAARILAEMQASAGNSARANQAALTDALTKLLAGDENAQQLVDSLLAGDIAGASASALLYNPNGPDKPLGTATSTPDVDPFAAVRTPTSPGPMGTAGAPLPSTIGTPLAVIGEGWNVKFV